MLFFVPIGDAISVCGSTSGSVSECHSLDPFMILDSQQHNLKQVRSRAMKKMSLLKHHWSLI